MALAHDALGDPWYPVKGATDAVTFLHSYFVCCGFIPNCGTTLTALRQMQDAFSRIVVQLYLDGKSYHLVQKLYRRVELSSVALSVLLYSHLGILSSHTPSTNYRNG